jgi:hypothetical protein
VAVKKHIEKLPKVIKNCLGLATPNFSLTGKWQEHTAYYSRFAVIFTKNNSFGGGGDQLLKYKTCKCLQNTKHDISVIDFLLSRVKKKFLQQSISFFHLNLFCIYN